MDTFSLNYIKFVLFNSYLLHNYTLRGVAEPHNFDTFKIPSLNMLRSWRLPTNLKIRQQMAVLTLKPQLSHSV